MYALVALGKNDTFLGVLKTAEDANALELMVEELEPLVLANIEGELPLRERMMLAPFWFSGIGAMWGFEIVDLSRSVIQEKK